MQRYTQATGGDMEEYELGEWVRFEDVRDVLQTLHNAAEMYAADQSRATDERCGLVQPITVAEGNDLNAALALVADILAADSTDDQTESDFYSDDPSPDWETPP